MGWTEATGRVSKPIRGVAWNHVLGKKDSTKSFVTEVEADAWWRQRETELTGVYESAGVDKPRQQRNVPTLAEFGRFYLPMRDREDRTHDQNLNVFNTMIRQFWGENVKVIDVSKIDVLAMLHDAKTGANGQRRPCGPSGRRNKLVVLRSVFAGAIEHGYRQNDPTREVPTPYVPHRKQHKRTMTLAEVDAVYAAMQPWLAAAVYVFAHAGLRISECCGLQIANVDELNNEILVQHTIDDKKRLRPYPKGKEPLPVPMGPTLKRILLRHISEHSSPKMGLVFYNHKQGVPVRPAEMRKWFYQAVKDAGLTGRRPTPHDLRHFTATHMADNGAEAYDIQLMLRHRNLGTSQRYIDDVSSERRSRLPMVFEAATQWR